MERTMERRNEGESNTERGRLVAIAMARGREQRMRVGERSRK